mgnify:CR=1 FL=1
MSLLKKLGKVATTASLIGTLAATSVFGVKAQEPQQSQPQETKKISRKYPQEFGLTINGEPSSIVYTYLGTISSQEYNQLFEKEKNVIDKATELTERISGMDAPIDISSLHEKFRIPDLTEEDSVDIYQVKPEIPITTIDGSQSAGDMFSIVTFVKSNKPEITSLEARINDNNELEISVQATDKTDYKDQERTLIQSIQEEFIQGKLPPEDLTILLGETEKSDLSYQYTITDENEGTRILETTQNQYTIKNPFNSKNLTIEAIVKDEIGNETEKRMAVTEQQETTKETKKYKILFRNVATLGDKYEDKLYTINDDGSNLQEIVLPNRYSNPYSSPDGNKIAFVSYTNGEYDIWGIWIANIDGSNLQKLTESSTLDKCIYGWSNNQEIIFGLTTNIEVGNGWYLPVTKINIMNISETKLIEIPKKGYLPLKDGDIGGGRLTISPDGNKIAFVSCTNGEYDICIANTDGSNLQKLTETPNIVEGNISFFPNSKKIIFDGTVDTKKVYKENPSDIYVIDLGNNQIRNLTNTLDIDECNPILNPDGNKIIFNITNKNQVLPELHIMNSDGNDKKDLLNTPSLYLEVYPVWSPDGSKIVFERYKTNERHKEYYNGIFDGIECNNIESSELCVLDNNKDSLIKIRETNDDLFNTTDFNSKWSPDGERILFSAETDLNTHDLYIINTDGTNLKKITNTPTGFELILQNWLPN